VTIHIDRPHVMTCSTPATRWEDALPTGNGCVGAMVHGRVRSECILLNHESLFLRTDKPRLPDVSGHLPQLRRLLAEGRYEEAENFLPRKLHEAGYTYNSPDPYHPAFDIEIEQDTRQAFADYSRTLDLSTGEVTVAWTEGGVRFTRRLIVSRPDGLVALHIAADRPGAVSLDVRLTPHGRRKDSPQADTDGRVARRAEMVYHSRADAPTMEIVGMYDRGGGFGGVGRVVTDGGSMETHGDRIAVERADEVTVLVGLFANESAEAAIERINSELSEAGGYQSILARHAPTHRELFHRCRLDLDCGPTRQRSNERLLLDGYSGEVAPALIERMFDFGRHLLICSSWGGRLPANLQGIWNGDYAPKWSSDFHNNENIQMNYWAALPGNLPETTRAYFDFYERSLEDYRRNARQLFDCRGIVAAHAQTTHGLQLSSLWLNWTAGAGWLAQLFHEYWLFTGDETFLRERAIPFMKEVALFYEDFCVLDDEGQIVFSPSISPENSPADVEGRAKVTVNATMDYAVARELLTNLCDACEMLGVEEDGVLRWRGLLEAMPEYEVNDDGAIAEWMHPALGDNYHHRHLSHIYPLFPGSEVTAESDPALFDAIENAVEKRLVVGLNSQTGWSLAHMANIWARLGDAGRAAQCLQLLARACTGANLLTYHNDWRQMGLTLSWGGGTVYQIDANLGTSAAVLEMLLFSKPGLVNLLPALPADWPSGRICGMRARGGVTVSIEWDTAAGVIVAELIADEAGEITLGAGGRIRSIECDCDEAFVERSDFGNAYREVTLPANVPVTLTIQM
jgi:alpha-L-fucosidase 2